jgi:hypothetical protein
MRTAIDQEVYSRLEWCQVSLVADARCTRISSELVDVEDWNLLVVNCERPWWVDSIRGLHDGDELLVAVPIEGKKSVSGKGDAGSQNNHRHSLS